MYHRLTVHIYQSPSNVSKLSEEMISSATGAVYSRTESYKFKTVRIPVRLDELIYISIGHPFRCHHELVVAHHHSQQWQHVLMTKGFPRHDLLAEPLCGWRQPVSTSSLTNWKTHPFDLHKVACRKYLQNFDRNLDPLMFTLPYFGEPAFVSRVFRPVVAERDLY